MRIGVVVDSGCDLPKSFIDENKIVVLPISIRVGDQTLVDNRDPAATLEFYKKHLGDKGHDAESIPFSMEQIRDLFLQRLVVDFDYVFCLTIMSSRSPIYENAMKASLAIINGYKPIRSKAGHASPFALRVMDTQNLFAGQGVSAVEVVRMIKAGESANRIRERLEHIIRNTYLYGIPNDLFYLRARAQKKGDRSVGWMSAALGTALDIKPVIRAHLGETGPVAKLRHFDQGCQKLFAFVTERVKVGLIAPIVCISYGGPLEDLRKLPGYEAFAIHCRANKVEVYESNMSLTGAVNVGEGALTIGFASGPHEVAF